MKKNYFLFTLLISTVITFLSCARINKETTDDALVSHIDSTIKPGNDFFLFANGKWFKQNPIPASEQSNGIWQLIQDTINAQVRKVCETSAAIKDATVGTNKQKIGDFFFTGMDSVSLNKNGIADIRDDLNMIDGIMNVSGLIKAASYLHSVGCSPLFRFSVSQDDKISSKNAVFISQGGLSLPDRSFYFDNDARTAGIREKFMTHLQNAFDIMGYGPEKAKSAATDVLRLETAIAGSSRKREGTRDPWMNYNKMTFKQLAQATPDIDWKAYLTEEGLNSVDSVIVGQPEFLKAIDGYLRSYSLSDWKDYLKYHLIRTFSGYMDDNTYMEFYNFYSGALRGVKEPKPRWKRVVEQTDRSLGDLIGQVYTVEYLPRGTKEKMVTIGNDIKTVFAGRIRSLDWMSNATKEKALDKLSSVIMKVGYPDKWKDMSTLKIDRSSYAKNIMSANRWRVNYMITRYGKPVDRSEWEMEPQTYNAYYNPSNNEVCIPGCNIIVPGYESKMADDAILYSIIGATFGHEITHGFDDQGAKYNSLGNLRNWWSADDSLKFNEKTRMIVRQFNNYIAVDSLHINGELTQGENIADLGGTIMAYEAFKNTDQYRNNTFIAGYSPSQRFFLGYALAWMVNERPEAVANQVKSNEHSPAKFRVNGPLSNMPEFYQAFDVKKGDELWVSDSMKVRIW